MNNFWPEESIENIKDSSRYSIAMGPFGSNIKTENFVSSGIPVIRGINLSDFRFHDDDFVFLTENKAEELKSANALPGDIVFTHRGTLGQVGIIPQNSRFDRYVVSQSQMKLRVDKNKVDPYFVFYYFKSPLGQNKLLANTSTTGVPAISSPLSSLRSIKIPLPPLPEQRAIAEVLSALDDKIELNRRMNQTLESLAQAIFKHMFIDNPEREGWVEAKLDSICRFEYGKALKAEHRKNGNIPVFGSNGCVGYHDDYLVKGPGIIIGRKGNPGTVMFSFTDFFVIDTAFYIVPKNSTNIYWLYYALKELNLPNLGADSAVPGLNRNIAYLSEITIPPSKLCLNFESVIRPIFEKKYLNDQESNILAELRDTLLPRLMSGQVRVV